MASTTLHVTKRAKDGDKATAQVQELSREKLLKRLSRAAEGLDLSAADVEGLCDKIIAGLRHGIDTHTIDELAWETAAASGTKHPDWSKLAGRLVVSNLHKKTESSFSANIEKMHKYRQAKTGRFTPLIADDVYEVVMAHREQLDAVIDYSRDFDFSYFGVKTLMKGYLLKMDGVIVERPQQLYLRVGLGIHKGDVKRAIQTYHYMSQKYFTHATPTLFNAGTPKPQMSSCFLLTMADDSIEGIYDTLKQCACISKYAGGIGLSIHNIRAAESYIAGTNGTSNGIVPMLRVFNDTARYVDQGGGKRKGSFAMYLEPWHADIEAFLQLKINHGQEELRARDLFYALWIPDLFMKRVLAKGTWSLFCPNIAKGLCDVYGDEFEALYTKYEAQGLAKKQMPAVDLWYAILSAQMETGTPYMMYKDACNRKSNQQNLGTIRSSNLCTEIVEYTSPDEIAVCNLASIALNKFVNAAEGTFDFKELYTVTKFVARNLNKVIDVNFYPLPQARNSNMRHRPVGIGVQGLADTFCLLRMPFDSPAAQTLNAQIFETIYFGAVEASMELAQEFGPYSTFDGSPASQGKLQFDLWGVTPSSGLWDWAKLKADVVKHGLRNSLLVSPMPTASTAQIMGNNEGMEPFTSNMYTRRTLAGDFVMCNKHLVRDLIKLGLWDDDMRHTLMMEHGSVQRIPSIPDDIKALYKTVWEIKQREIVNMAAARGPFICQSQSMNIHMASPTKKMLTSMHFHAWKKGLKTGMYYLRSKAKADPIQFTVNKAANKASHGIKGKDRSASMASVTSVGTTEEDKESEPSNSPERVRTASLTAGTATGEDTPAMGGAGGGAGAVTINLVANNDASTSIASKFLPVLEDGGCLSCGS